MQHLSDAVTADCDILAANDLEKKRCYLQWRGNKPEQDAVASALQNLHSSVCYYIVASSYKLCTLINYVKRTRRPDSEFAIVELTPAVALAVLAVHSLAIAKTCHCTFTFLSN